MIEMHELRTHIWDLRAQLESQLRRTGALQLLTEALAGSATAADDRERMLKELADIAAISGVVATIARQAGDVVSRLSA